MTFPRSRAFTGFDAYQKLIASGVDIVLHRDAAALPARPTCGRSRGRQAHLPREAAGVDGPGVRSVIETAEPAAARADA